ncbi:unnamed protein product [Polarella glacialis]|uniref:C3H1-type domain-containing protein n=1 Tax=Polarella glacialis TaxID=89957 RepID=A0A813DQT1_POLGL|nr:unnamed protein product [Polarella glacialis]
MSSLDMEYGMERSHNNSNNNDNNNNNNSSGDFFNQGGGEIGFHGLVSLRDFAILNNSDNNNKNNNNNNNNSLVSVRDGAREARKPSHFKLQQQQQQQEEEEEEQQQQPVYAGTGTDLQVQVGKEINKRTRFCKFFSQGKCSRGEGCSFAHYTEQLRQRPDVLKTSLCHAYTEFGICAAGSACKFAHGVGELRRPVLGGERLAAESKTMETFSALSLDSETHEELGECGHAKNSNNNNNDALGFGDQTLDSESASTMSSESPKGKDRAIHRLKAQTQSGRPMQAHLKTRYCKFFREGRCLRGELCMFAHAKQDIRPEPYLFRTSPCFDFLRHGSCRVGDDCKFAHSLEDLRGNELTGRKDSGMLGAPASTDLSDYLPQASFLSQTSSESVGSLRTYIPSAQDDDNHNNKWHDESSMRSSTADVEQFNMASNNGSSDDAQVRATLELMVEAQPSRVQATHFASRRLNNNNNSNSNSNSSIIEELLASRVSSISI